jgi:hypothetical protein
MPRGCGLRGHLGGPSTQSLLALGGNRMIGVLTHHWAKADKIDEARKLLDGNG